MGQARLLWAWARSVGRFILLTLLTLSALSEARDGTGGGSAMGGPRARMCWICEAVRGGGRRPRSESAGMEGAGAMGVAESLLSPSSTRTGCGGWNGPRCLLAWLLEDDCRMEGIGTPPVGFDMEGRGGRTDAVSGRRRACGAGREDRPCLPHAGNDGSERQDV